MCCRFTGIAQIAFDHPPVKWASRGTLFGPYFFIFVFILPKWAKKCTNHPGNHSDPPLKQEFVPFDVGKSATNNPGKPLRGMPTWKQHISNRSHAYKKEKDFVLSIYSSLDMSEASTVRTKLQHSPTHINFTRVRRNFWSKHCTSEMLKICCLHILIIQAKNYQEMVFFSTCGLWPCAPSYEKFFFFKFLELNTWCMKLIKHLFPHENTLQYFCISEDLRRIKISFLSPESQLSLCRLELPWMGD